MGGVVNCWEEDAQMMPMDLAHQRVFSSNAV